MIRLRTTFWPKRESIATSCTRTSVVSCAPAWESGDFDSLRRLYAEGATLPDRIVMLDWGLAGEAPAALDFGWYLFVNGWRIDATREQVIDDFLELDAADAVEPALLATFCWIAPLVAHELVEASDEKRERARTEFAWWIARTQAALERM